MKTLVILAAGLGSRFGGKKQIEEIGPNGEYIIDYSIYDALRVGFNKIVFVIRKDDYEIFRNTIGKRIENKAIVKYVFQTNDFQNIKNRKKPLGTAHAIYSCKNVIKEPFMVINADDFYGYDAYKKGYEFLNNNLKNKSYGLVAYKIENTLSDNGNVKRGICFSKNGYLTELIESEISKKEDKILATPLDKNIKPFTAKKERVSMNMLLLNNSIFEYMKKDFPKYLNNIQDKENFELLIPNIITDGIKEKAFTCEIIKTSSIWNGITYKEDLIKIKQYINKQIKNGIYPKNLWN